VYVSVGSTLRAARRVPVEASARLKRTPQLTFEYDPTVEHGVRMSQLIDELAPEDDADVE
jgi:ribosome-binding factor A